MEENFIVTAGHDTVKRVLALQMRREMTASERLLWQHLRANRLGGLHFRRQQIIDGFIADFFCHAAKLVVELDGGVHEDRQEYDAERDRRLSTHGLHILRFTNSELKNNLPSVLHKILTTAQGQLEAP
jgi:very-short-patch-repair endonuclease